ncbi:hypothetical protein MKX03_007358 [Papaver bracteatum]|nr:hypothetical protein MKX03_007358 [Papaver bracteatum]
MSSPPLEWHNVPDGTKSLAIVVQDLDSDVIPWTAWVVINIPPSLKGLPEGFSCKGEELGGDYAEIQEGHNDQKVTKEKLIEAVEGHVLGEAVLLSIF